MIQRLARKISRNSLFAAGLGMACATGLAPLSLWPVSLVSLALVGLLYLRCKSVRAAGTTGWFFGFGYFAIGLLWIVEPFLVDVARHGWMAPFALVFMSGGLSLFWTAAFMAAARWGKSDLSRMLLLVAFWGLAEFARAYLLTGFPWAAFAQHWVDTPVALLLAWIGPHGLALGTLCAALLAALAVHRRSMKPLVGTLPVLVAAFLPFWFAGETAETDAVIRMVQPNAPQHQKWDPAHIPIFYQRQLDMTAAGSPPDLIVWPETAIPSLLDQAGPVLAEISHSARGSPVVLGLRRIEGSRIYNSAVLIDGTGVATDIYDKHHLVPFGEYVPFGDLAARFGIHGFAAEQGQGFSAGPGPRLMDLGPLGTALPLICYEAVFPQDVNAAPARPTLLMQLTNDAWFGTHSGPYQHMAQARMRAIEQGLPMLRVANTGVSAMIDPHGKVMRQIPLGQSGYADAALPAPLPPTFYSSSGDLPALVVLFLVAGIAIRFDRRISSSNTD
ncbi:apolipoprotein N-acyltransferase [Primorskyibacter sp. S87]|uniref:apolipoprotein N-acyltransferase n=1 Tax=Primorskyibacter sp. S87 TaxID=3415126 RepID=UPI003C7AF66E